VFDKFSDWEHITAPYGPIWTAISRLIDWMTGTSPLATSIGFKALDGIAALGLALIVWRLAEILTGDRRRAAAAFVLVAWSPIVLYESAGTAHLDPLLMLLAMGGLLALVSQGKGRTRAGLLLVAASALCKPVTIPLIGLGALVRLSKRRDTLKLVYRKWILDIFAVLALVVVTFAPYWQGGSLPGGMLENQRHLYVDKPLRSNPFWIWLFPEIGINGSWLPARGSTIAQGLAALLVLATAVWLIRRELRLRERVEDGDPSPSMLLRWQVHTWAVVMFALSYIPPNAHAWYMIWAIPLVALITVDRIPLPKLTPASATNGHVGEPPHLHPKLKWALIAFYAWSFMSFFIYHTFTRS
jgi:hypothetical protein